MAESEPLEGVSTRAGGGTELPTLPPIRRSRAEAEAQSPNRLAFTTPTRPPARSDRERIDDVVLSELTENNISPVTRLCPGEEEEELEAAAYAECPGAPDSEDEDEDNHIGNMNELLLESQLERAEYADEIKDAEVDFATYLAQYRYKLEPDGRVL